MFEKIDDDFLLDIAVVSFASDLIALSKKVEKKEVNLNGVLINDKTDENHKKISWQMEKLQKKLTKTFDKLKPFHKAQLPYHIRLIENADLYGSEIVQPDYFAIYLLRFRFYSAKWANKREVNKRFQWLIDKGSELFNILELLSETPIAASDEDMAELAKKVISNKVYNTPVESKSPII